MRRLFLLLVFAGGCWSVIDEATQSHVDPGGKVQAQMGPGQIRTTTALASAKSEPMKIQGASSELTFSLTAAQSQGGTAITDLMQPGSASVLTIDSTTRNQLEVHLDGSGCVATQGTVHLMLNDSKNIDGDFDADGTVSGGTSACHMSGQLAGVPLDK
jgi:hypothetical protein